MFSRLSSALSISVIVLLSILDLALLHQNRSLKQRLALQQIHVQPGVELPPLRGITLQGQAEELRYGEDSRDTLMLVFSPQCGWCQRNMANWTALAQGVEKKKFRTVAVAMKKNGAAEYATSHGWTDFPVMIEVDPRDAVSYRLLATPQTILIDSEGVVRKLWLGAFDAQQEKEIENFFEVELPGLANPIRPL